MKNKILAFFLFTTVLTAIGYFIWRIYDCGYTVFCYTLNTKASGLFLGSFSLAFVFLILLFVPHIVKAWKKFALWYIPLATLLFIFYPEPGSGDYFSPYPEQVFQWVSAFYVGASLGIILTALVSDAQEKKGNKPFRWWWYIAPALLLGYGAIAVLPFVLQLLWL